MPATSRFTNPGLPAPAPPATLATWLPVVPFTAGCNTLATQRTYTSVLRGFINGAQVDLERVTSNTVLAYKAGMVKRGLSPRTIRHHLIVLSCFFSWAIDGGYHPGPNPVAGVPLPRAGGALAGVAISPAEVRRLLFAAANTRDRALLGLLAATGLRAAEACNLRQKDLHFPELDLVAVHVCSGKGGKARDVAVRDMDLSVYLSAYLVDRQCAGPFTYLFQARDGRAVLGRPISRDLVYKIVKTTAARAGLGHVTPHDLRRTYATNELSTGEKLPVLQARMGHSRMEQTARYYRD